MQNKIHLLNGSYLTTESEPCSHERAVDILQAVSYILDCQKKFWKERIIDLFSEFITVGTEPQVLMSRKKEGLYWKFHREIFIAMCDAWENE